jgi:hypothetical protein
MIRVVLTPAFRASMGKSKRDSEVVAADFAGGALVFGGVVIGLPGPVTTPTTVIVTKPCERTPFYRALLTHRFRLHGLSIAEPRLACLPSSARVEAAQFTTLFWPRAAHGRGGFRRDYLEVVWLEEVALSGASRRVNKSNAPQRLTRRRAPYELPGSELPVAKSSVS